MVFKLKIEYFKYLQEIEKSKSISSASRKLYMGQTTLSSILKKVENELGFPIFHRTPKGVYPTKKGNELLKICSEINTKLDKVQFLKDDEWQDTNPILLYLCPSINMCNTLELSKMFSSRTKKCKIVFKEEDRITVVTKTYKQNNGIGITYLFNHEIDNIQIICKKYNLNIEEVINDKLYLCVSQEHELAKRESVNIEELYNYKYVTCCNYNIDFFEGFKDLHNNFISLSNMYLVVDTILSGNAFGFFTGYFSSFHLNKKLFSIIPVTNLKFENIIKICVISKNENLLGHYEREILKCIEEYFKKWSL